MIRYIHGSSNSADIDTIYVFDHIPDFSEAKSFCDGKKTENANIICVEMVRFHIVIKVLLMN